MAQLKEDIKLMREEFLAMMKNQTAQIQSQPQPPPPTQTQTVDIQTLLQILELQKGAK